MHIFASLLPNTALRVKIKKNANEVSTMLHETIQLSEKYPGATLTTYVSYDPPELNMPPRRAIIVCPGGGYHFLSDREAEPIVKMYLAAGLNVFLLRYRV